MEAVLHVCGVSLVMCEPLSLFKQSDGKGWTICASSWQMASITVQMCLLIWAMFIHGSMATHDASD